MEGVESNSVREYVDDKIFNFLIKPAQYCESISEISKEYNDATFNEIKQEVIKAMCNLQMNVLTKEFKNGNREKSN